MDTGGFRSRTVVHHNYSDNPDTAKSVLSAILTEGFRITKPRAVLFIFCDIDLFIWLKDSAARAGWDPFKLQLPGSNLILKAWHLGEGKVFAVPLNGSSLPVKVRKGLIHSPVDHLRHNRVSRDEREYGPEKPVPLISELLAASTLPGDYVLDPCCGSGSTLVAARALNMRALGIESDEKAYNLALVKSQQKAAG